MYYAIFGFILFLLSQNYIRFCQAQTNISNNTGIFPTTSPSNASNSTITITTITRGNNNATTNINNVTVTVFATTATMPDIVTSENELVPNRTITTTNATTISTSTTTTPLTNTTTTPSTIMTTNTTVSSTTTITTTTTTTTTDNPPDTTLPSPQNRLYLAVRFQSRFAFLPSNSKIFSLEPDNFDGELNLNDNNQVAVNGQSFSQFWAMATDYHRKVVYYTDYNTNFIGVYNVQTRESKSVFQGLSYGIDGVSVDWYTGNVYWVDTSQNWIMVAESTFTYYRNIANITSKVPARIAIDATARNIYWSEVGDTECRIKQSDLAGNNIRTLHTFTDIMSIDAISLDTRDGRLYWTERLRRTASSETTNSRVRFLILASPETVETVYITDSSVLVALTTYENYIYVCDNIQHAVFVLNKTSSARIYDFTLSSSQHPRAITIFSEYLQPIERSESSNPCANHSCEDDICIPGDGNTFSCICSFGSYPGGNGTYCIAEIFQDDFALLLDSAHQKIYQILLSNPSQYSSLPIANIGHVEAIDYDPLMKTIYWLDSRADIIYKSSLNGSNHEVFAYNVQAVSFAIDHSSRNLYYANTLIDAIVVTSLDVRNVTNTLQVHNIYRVLELYVSSKLGKVFWSDWGQISSSGPLVGAIESMDLDGGNRTTLVQGSTYPNGITIDYENNFLYWTEYRTGKIGWMNMNTKVQGTYTVTTSSALLESISYLAGNLYIIDHLQNHVQRVSVGDVMNDIIGTTAVQQYGPSVFFRLKGIEIFTSENHEFDPNVCAVNRGGCPQICLPISDQPSCVCGDNFVYEASNNTCIQTHPNGDVTPPSFGNSCPSGIVQLTVDKCSDSATYHVTPPNATDDSGKVVVKSTFTQQPSFQISTVQPRLFHFTASDLSGNKAYCNYVVVASAVTCPPFDSISFSTGSSLGTPSCGSEYGSVFDVTCPGADHVLLQYECDVNGEWTTYSDTACPFISTSSTTNSPTTTLATTVTNPLTKSSFVNSNTTLISPTSGGLPTGAVVVIVLISLVLLGIVIFAIYKFRHRFKIPGLYIWHRGDDTIQLTDTSLFLHPGSTTESNIYT